MLRRSFFSSEQKRSEYPKVFTDFQRNAHAVREYLHTLNVKLDELPQPRYLSGKYPAHDLGFL